jgi:hypothetical protein
MGGRDRGVALTIHPNSSSSSSVKEARNRTATSTARNLPDMLLSTQGQLYPFHALLNTTVIICKTS